MSGAVGSGASAAVTPASIASQTTQPTAASACPRQPSLVPGRCGAVQGRNPPWSEVGGQGRKAGLSCPQAQTCEAIDVPATLSRGHSLNLKASPSFPAAHSGPCSCACSPHCERLLRLHARRHERQRCDWHKRLRPARHPLGRHLFLVLRAEPSQLHQQHRLYSL